MEKTQIHIASSFPSPILFPFSMIFFSFLSSDIFLRNSLNIMRRLSSEDRLQRDIRTNTPVRYSTDSQQQLAGFWVR